MQDPKGLGTDKAYEAAGIRREVNPLQSHRRPANDPPHTITEGETP
jgi:hypothetical protein